MATANDQQLNSSPAKQESQPYSTGKLIFDSGKRGVKVYCKNKDSFKVSPINLHLIREIIFHKMYKAPNIPNLRRVDPELVIVRELFEQSLYQYIYSNIIGVTAIKEIINVILRCLQGMARYGLIHRDIKLANILVNTYNNIITNVIVTDFGTVASVWTPEWDEPERVTTQCHFRKTRPGEINNIKNRWTYDGYAIAVIIMQMYRLIPIDKDVKITTQLIERIKDNYLRKIVIDGLNGELDIRTVNIASPAQNNNPIIYENKCYVDSQSSSDPEGISAPCGIQSDPEPLPPMVKGEEVDYYKNLDQIHAMAISYHFSQLNLAFAVILYNEATVHLKPSEYEEVAIAAVCIGAAITDHTNYTILVNITCKYRKYIRYLLEVTLEKVKHRLQFAYFNEEYNCTMVPEPEPEPEPTTSTSTSTSPSGSEMTISSDEYPNDKCQ